MRDDHVTTSILYSVKETITTEETKCIHFAISAFPCFISKYIRIEGKNVLLRRKQQQQQYLSAFGTVIIWNDDVTDDDDDDDETTTYLTKIMHLN